MDQPKKILLVQLYSNGDSLYATAIARQIKIDFPGCKLSWMIASFCKDIISHNQDVDNIIVVDGLVKNDVIGFRALKKKVLREKKQGIWNEVFITHNMDTNQALYDGTIRGMILRAYHKPVTVPLQPQLFLTAEEKARVKEFAGSRKLREFKNVILWEFAPQSGQSQLNFDFVFSCAKRLTAIPGTSVILSSGNWFTETQSVFDASKLTVRENAELTHYCSLLIGCSSGITWLSTSNAAKFLPMLQLLDGQAFFRNAPSVDFKRYGIPDEELIEITSFSADKIHRIIEGMIITGASAAKKEFNEPLPVQFHTTRKVVYNLLCYFHFRSIVRHFRITTSIYGAHPRFLKEFALGILGFPFKFIANKWRKRKKKP